MAAAGLAQAWDLGRRSPGMDFYQFWAVAQLVGRADVPSIYDEEAHPRLGAELVRRSLTEDDSERRRAAAREWQVLEPTATPLLYSTIRPFAGLRYDDAHLVFRLLSLATLAAGIVAIALRLGHAPATALLALAFATLAFQPVKADIRVGNVNQLQLGGIAAYLWLSSGPEERRRQVGAGALLGALVLWKPNLLAVPLVLAAVWATRGRSRKLTLQAVGLAAGAVLGLVVSALFFGSFAAWRDWFEYLRVFPPEKIPLRFGNFGLARIAYETMGLRPTPWLLALALAAALAAVWVGRAKGERLDDPARAMAEDTAALAAGCFVYLLSAPLVWDHYLLLALPPGLLLLRDRNETDGADPWRIAAVAALTLIAVDPAADLFQVRDLLQQAILTGIGVIVLFALTLRELARPRP